MENKNIIQISFDKLVNSFGIEKEPEQNIDNSLVNNFCNDECYQKFLNVLGRIKMGQIDINNLNLSDGENNILANMLTHYYNSGYTQGNSDVENK
jgi:hypothetical protein